MKKLIVFVLLFTFITSGCTSYKYLHNVKPYGDGYVVSRNDTIVPEYTVGGDEVFPKQLKLAEERFKRRRKKVEYYYKRMGIFYQPVITFLSYPASLAGIIMGIFKLPFIVVSDYRYEHNPQYRKKIDDIEANKKAREDRERQRLQDGLDNFIKQDLEKDRAVRQALDSIKEEHRQ